MQDSEMLDDKDEWRSDFDIEMDAEIKRLTQIAMTERLVRDQMIRSFMLPLEMVRPTQE